MYLHLGGDIVINQGKIVAIVDLNTAKKTAEEKFFPENYQDKEKVIFVSEMGKEKSLIITVDGSYFSPISSTTLLKRSMFLNEPDEPDDPDEK
ncbi:MAG: DUF370 domain-containing protein [Desulfitobacteriaceae bacterium]|nr:DUF370 domain-containing protein [Desulfitobacteriaceae bacterium]MDI6915522.1 DUF370 domain-containing protein [Desulfitobacteriaceae bacterium]